MDGMNDDGGISLDAYLSHLTPSQREEALAAAAAAKRAEERAERRELERAMHEKEERRRLQKQQEEESKMKGFGSTSSALSGSDRKAGIATTDQQLVYIPKRKREQMQKEATTDPMIAEDSTAEGVTNGGNRVGHVLEANRNTAATVVDTTGSAEPALSAKERMAVIQTYLGKSATAVVQQDNDQKIRKRKQMKANKKTTFKFRWDETDDTSNFDDPDDPIYAPLKSRSISHTAQNKPSFNRPTHKSQKIMGGEVSSMITVMHKPIDQMTARDWRILRENYEISVRGGQAPPPMRTFSESPAPSYLPQLHPTLLDAIYNVLRFKEPSPIQRQAIPIGLQRRDLIGISETGSGKTVAFGVPMCHYLLHLPTNVLASVADQGPLALVMAPTRELALQIEVELSKLLSRQSVIQSTAVVGGQPIQQQAQMIRRGVHIIVGTPGRINDCIEMAYLVLNQCCYIVMDEADRMIDMGFAPQMESMYV
jgi:DEAD/DEAH box helicase